jgi:hypothetical protein
MLERFLIKRQMTDSLNAAAARKMRPPFKSPFFKKGDFLMSDWSQLMRLYSLEQAAMQLS